MLQLRPSRAQDAPRVIEIWRRAVDATHGFLSPAGRNALDAEVAGFLPTAPLLLAVDATDRPLAFMWVTDGHMEALFVDPDARGSGIGRQLVGHALREDPRLTTDVNEQNGQAVGFYQRLGFTIVGHSPLDGQGRPYPLLHLRAGEAGAPDPVSSP